MMDDFKKSVLIYLVTFHFVINAEKNYQDKIVAPMLICREEKFFN